ncbi:MAG: beta-galactosidase [Pseudomonadota bacterium]
MIPFSKTFRFLIGFLCSFLLVSEVNVKAEAPKPGFVVHFDFIKNASEGCVLVDIAARAGARVINLVPPAHVWEDPASLAALDAIINEINRRGLSLIFTRIDAAKLPDRSGKRPYYLYDRILNEPGRLPNGKATVEVFLATVGKDGYAEWMEEETRYYAKHYGGLPNLIGINLGPFSEPFSAERCGFLEYMAESRSYEITQYTRYAQKWWHGWLASHYDDVSALNREYGTEFVSFNVVPMPLNEKDRRFERADLAYFDFARSLNDWYVERYTRCRKIWHEESKRADVPFILQFNGGLAEKFAMGRPGHAAFDVPGWISMADAIGVSLYTNSGYPDMGHRSILATVNLLAVAGDMGKPIFVLEGGNEAPNVTLDPVELAFFGSVAGKLFPQTYVYEFLKDKFNEKYTQNPGKLVTAGGRIRSSAFSALHKLFTDIESHSAAPEIPALYVCFDSISARGNARAGIRYAALFDLAASIPIRWIPKGQESVMRPGIPVLNPDGTVSPVNDTLSRLMSRIPEIDSGERAEWCREVLKALGR